MYLISLDNIQDNTREKGCYKSSCTVSLTNHWTTYISLDNIHDSTREEKGCYKSSYNLVSLNTYMITLRSEKGCYKSSCTSYHWTTYRINTSEEKGCLTKSLMGQHRYHRGQPLQDNAPASRKGCYKSQEKGCYLYPHWTALQDNTREERCAKILIIDNYCLIKSHGPQHTGQHTCNTREEKGYYKSSCTRIIGKYT
ncbi:unnamed protein product [Mytilus edulis]|uniref:Uncharacterized protein n=1 Tax=Mytilus edulis TaxID=6550 RepID=A0A8S3UK50_MYTED|nr:unnamed protein product [Mytilus edulis]